MLRVHELAGLLGFKSQELLEIIMSEPSLGRKVKKSACTLG